MKPKFFRTPADFRRWLRQHHGSAPELVVGFYKVTSGKPSITWPESVDEALCFGWIDGVRRRVDDLSYTIRFTPRRPGSIWSAINTRRVRALIAAKRMAPGGRRAFTARKPNKSGQQIPSYRRAAVWWVLSTRQEATRRKRAATLVELSAGGKLIPQFRRYRPPAAARGS